MNSSRTWRACGSLAGALHDRPAGRGFAAHEQRDAEHAFVADHRDLGRCAVFHHVQQRHDGRGGKVNVGHGHARLGEDLPQRHGHRFELGQPPRPLFRREERRAGGCSGDRLRGHRSLVGSALRSRSGDLAGSIALQYRCRAVHPCASAQTPAPASCILSPSGTRIARRMQGTAVNKPWISLVAPAAGLAFCAGRWRKSSPGATTRCATNDHAALPVGRGCLARLPASPKRSASPKPAPRRGSRGPNSVRSTGLRPGRATTRWSWRRTAACGARQGALR